MVYTLVIGHSGEVGQALYRMFARHKKRGDSVKGISLDKRDQVQKARPDWMHVCIPYGEDFFKIVVDYVKEFKPKNVVIESTVPVGTTRKIEGRLDGLRMFELEDLPRCGVFHSPVRGKHPEMEAGLKFYAKVVGFAGGSGSSSDLVEHYARAGIKTVVFNNSDETELAKLLCTTYYGTLIGFWQEAWLTCDKLGLDFNNVMTVYTKQLKGLRPVMLVNEKGIGGHCVMPNLGLLNMAYPSQYAKALEVVNRRLIAAQGEKQKKERKREEKRGD